MPLQDKLVHIDELARALGRAEDWIKRNWLKLHMEQGMPRKLPTSWVWPRGAMERWFETYAAAKVGDDQVETKAGDVSELRAIVANENRSLRSRYAGGLA